MITEDKVLQPELENTEENDNTEVDFGLHVIYDGKKNTLMLGDQKWEYPIGGLIAECVRTRPTEVKEVLLDDEIIDEPATPDNMAKFLYAFMNRLLAKFSPAAAIMINKEFSNTIEDWFMAIRTDRGELYNEMLRGMVDGEVKEFIFKDSGYTDVGMETVKQMALSAYCSFALGYVQVTYTFKNLVDFDGEKEASTRSLDLMGKLYSELIYMQHIDYRILLVEGKFESMYTIKTSNSLLLFEMAHCIDEGIQFVKCANCGHYFVPEGRSDTIYCNYPSNQNPEKTCREIGAQVRRANKEKNDVVTREYRKVYMRYKVMTRRHPENREAAKKFDRLTENVPEWRGKLADGTATTDEFLAWLSEF